MQERLFVNPSVQPTDPALHAALGTVHPLYTGLLCLCSSYAHQWNFSKSGGWMLKVHHGKKALFYLIPLKAAFRISLALRVNEREAFLQDAQLGILREQVACARKVSEGYVLQFEIRDEKGYRPLQECIRKLLSLRAGS